MGITQHAAGTNNVLALANLAMAAGQIGKPFSGVNPLRGQNNVQGACDVGGLPNVYTGYQRVDDDAVRQKFEKAWGVSLSPRPGLTLMEMMKGIADGKIKALFILGENPFLSDPNAAKVQEELKHLSLLVVQDIFLSETAELAHVVLPGVSFAEKDGTFTNTERRVHRVRKAIEPVGNARADWQIICDLSSRLGYPMTYASPKEIMDEIASLTPSYGGIRYDRLEALGLQWPCPTLDHPGGLGEKDLGLQNKLRPACAAGEPFEAHPGNSNTDRWPVFCLDEPGLPLGPGDKFCGGDRQARGEDDARGKKMNPDFVKPRYDAGGFAGIPNRITDTFRAGNYDAVVLFLVDGFGWRFFERFQDAPFLKRLARGGAIEKLTAQPFPSTTAAHQTTIHTGLPVGDSGIYEWYVYEPTLDRIIAPLLFSHAGTRMFLMGCGSVTTVSSKSAKGITLH